MLQASFGCQEFYMQIVGVSDIAELRERSWTVIFGLPVLCKEHTHVY